MSLSSMTWVALLLSVNAPYVRSQVKPGDPTSHCLYWPAGTVTVHQSETGNPETGPAALDAITRAFQSWQTIMNGCGSLTLTEGARVSDRTIGFDVKDLSNNRNVILFRPKSCVSAAPASDACWKDSSCSNKYDCWEYSDATIALTTTTYDTHTGRVYDADVEFNAGRFSFTTVDGPTCTRLPPPTQNGCAAYDVQNTMTHEAGHLIGLDHTDFPGSTMNPTAPMGEISKRTLDTGSRSFVCAAYPKGLPSQDCVVPPAPSILQPVTTGGCAATGWGVPAGALLSLVGLATRRRSARK